MYKLILIMLFCAGVAFSQFNQDTLKSWMDNGAPVDFILIDLRGTGDNITQVIANDKCTPYNLVWTDEFKLSVPMIGKDQHIVVYCKSGARASAAVTYLVSEGYVNVYNAGGFSSWTGSVKAYSDSVCMADSLLPAPSMLAMSAVSLQKKNVVRIALQRSMTMLHLNGVFPCNYTNITGLNGRATAAVSAHGVFLLSK